MTDDKGRKYDPSLHLDMDFGEALGRFGQTDPKEMRDLIGKTKRKKPPSSDMDNGGSAAPS